MSPLTIDLEGGRSAFSPGETVRGRAGWQLAGAAEGLELRLFWYTSGKGTQDVVLVEARALRAEPSGSESFDFRLPEGPYSFSGKLITLAWAIELIDASSGEVARCELVVSPTGEEVRLGGAAGGQPV